MATVKDLKDWQKDPQELVTPKIQFWGKGVMRGLLPLDEAKKLVKAGIAFIITSQAIGFIDNDGNLSS